MSHVGLTIVLAIRVCEPIPVLLLKVRVLDLEGVKVVALLWE